MASLTEKLEAAAYALTGPGTVKERLERAYGTQLADLQPGDFPREFRAEFQQLIDALHRERALPGDTVLKASLRKLSGEQATCFAMLIVRAYGRVAALKSSPSVQVMPGATTPLTLLLAAEAGRHR